MAKGFFAEATNGTFMPAQAIECSGYGQKGQRARAKTQSISLLTHTRHLTSPGSGPHTQMTSMLRRATTVTAVSTRALCAVAVSGLGIVLLILPR